MTAADPGSPGVPPIEPPPPDVITQTLPWEPEDCQIITIPLAEPNLRAQCANPATFVCPEGTTGVTAYKYRTRPLGTDEPWSGWRLLNGPCTPIGDPTDDLADAVARELKTLKIPPKHAKIAPITDWFAVQTPMTYYTDDTPELLTTTVLDTQVELELTPSSYSWDPGDGSTPLTTTEPGAPYPDQTITHTYTKVGTYRVTLTTTWTGRFRTPGTPWRPIAGTGTTTHTTAPFETREIRSVLS
ncbi:PKD domain-containing protein [Flavimobilis sp. GY10621]|uniref:PKD domain-containing protein n=1 Tax=Flavimobilis rhizosphaerae TaxID=2775421 RepID=A0ABR9DPZ1_9MICO|nr:PKD domain-containing protein [Flavimobilis rhizosphaerae]MBD9699198.1 PKD domain-containing protein [Flavimobilis rhizosphaerae]